MCAFRSLVVVAFLLVGAAVSVDLSLCSFAKAEETPADMLAAQIRKQGIVCDKAQSATRDTTLSKPDHEVWVLKCDNATYRISRYPDMAATVEQLRQPGR